MSQRPGPVGEHEEERLLGRAGEIGRVLARHGLRELFSGSGEDSTRERARRLRAALEELGPTFSKLGQVMSTRPDLLPPEFIEELSTLQEHVTPLTEAEVVAVMTEELGVPWEDVFESIQPRPLAAGTIAQVHQATLETGDRVVVKVQRPSARVDIHRDLGLLELFAEKAAGRPVFQSIVDVPAVIAHLSDSLRRELDFRQEAGNMERLRDVLSPYSRIDIPGVYTDISSARLLVMEEIDGVPVRDAPTGPARSEAARQMLEAYYRQILTVGFFHADPHPGNMKWWRDRIYLLDFGMVGELDRETRNLLLLMLMAVWQEDIPFLTDLILAIGGEQQRPDLDIPAIQNELRALLADCRHASLQEMELGPILQGITEIAVRHDVHVPSSLPLTGKALAQMQLATGELDPSLDPFAVAGSYILRSFASGLRSGVDIQRLVYETQKLKLRLSQLAEALERIAGARPGPRPAIEVMGLGHLDRTIRSASRRIAVAFVAGACIIGAVFAVNSTQAGSWVAVLLGAVGAVVAAGLLLDLRRDRS